MPANGRRYYPSDLTDTQWEIIRSFIPAARKGGRPRTTDVRSVINAFLYINRTGCAWRYLPREFPPWQTVYDYFSKWAKIGFLVFLCRTLAMQVREKIGKSRTPRLGIIDSQSVRAHYGENRGWDGYKKVRGRKRHILVDSLGLLWLCKAHSATSADETEAIKMFEDLPQRIRKKLRWVLADGAYRRKLPQTCQSLYGIEVTTLSSKKVKNAKIESNIKPRRWIVERTFAWFNMARRLSRDYEKKTLCSETMVYLAMLPILIKRLSSPVRDLVKKLFRHPPCRVNRWPSRAQDMH